MKRKISFVISVAYSEHFEDEVLKPLNIFIYPEESDTALGYYTVFGSEENISELENYLKGHHNI